MNDNYHLFGINMPPSQLLLVVAILAIWVVVVCRFAKPVIRKLKEATTRTEEPPQEPPTADDMFPEIARLLK